MPSAIGTWVVAVDRMIGLVLGIVVGFYLRQRASVFRYHLLNPVMVPLCVIQLSSCSANSCRGRLDFGGQRTELLTRVIQLSFCICDSQLIHFLVNLE